jgi:hypothetical protein
VSASATVETAEVAALKTVMVEPAMGEVAMIKVTKPIATYEDVTTVVGP